MFRMRSWGRFAVALSSGCALAFASGGLVSGVPGKTATEGEVDARVDQVLRTSEGEGALDAGAPADSLRGRMYAARITASKALGELDSRVARTSLPFLIRTLDRVREDLSQQPTAYLQAHQDDLVLWARVARSLGQIGDPLAAPALLQVLRTTKIREATVRQEIAVDQGRNVTQTDTVREDLLRDVRLAAIEALSALRVSYAVGDLIDLLTDPDLAIRTASHGVLRHLTNHDHPYDPKVEASLALGQNRWRQWWGRAHEQDRLDWMREGFVAGGVEMGDLSSHDALPALVAVLNHRSSWFRANARERILTLTWEVPLDGLQVILPHLKQEGLHPDAQDTLSLLFVDLAQRRLQLTWIEERLAGKTDPETGRLVELGVLPFAYEPLPPVDLPPAERERLMTEWVQRKDVLVSRMDTWLQAQISR
ncbi:MAG: hypothetical protein HY608_09270 [Planctomycetes bacterium]|nr:hypothetical protein [Planctomycetota bacterium]